MAIRIPSPLVEFILLGPLDDRRQLQDSPILGDVWVEFAREPDRRQDLIIAPYRGQHAGSVAAEIDKGLLDHEDEDPAQIAFLQGLIVARLTFREMMRVVAPKTKWWIKRRLKGGLLLGQGQEGGGAEGPREALKRILELAKEWSSPQAGIRRVQELPSLNRFWALTALILWAETRPKSSADEQIKSILEQATESENLDEMYKQLRDLAGEMLQDQTCDPLVWQVSLNRKAWPAISRSVPAVKADAATYLFKVNCSEIGWAVIDSGIAGDHPAFHDREGISRVKRSFDFNHFRKIVSLSNSKKEIRKKNVDRIMRDSGSLLNPPQEEEAHAYLEKLAEGARRRGPVHWELVERLVEIKPGTEPKSHHGTHVAGILGASKEAAAKAAGNVANADFADGMCPDISLYDFRVLAADVGDTEFAVIAALQFIRFLNDRDYFLTIHGANLSLSIPHDVRNFACGRTPVCDECERLVAGGVVVVAAAGNHGYKTFETREGSYDSYAAFSITDPGNADGVITVGATHRFWPHTYGVSFFSSRGPTGDGRIKPDLVAPGERIRAPLPRGEWGDLDGTSMAAPHVSGAAAMLMARYSELVGQPLRVKRILCSSATDLGRERSFQGHGMLDVLRAFQSI